MCRVCIYMHVRTLGEREEGPVKLGGAVGQKKNLVKARARRTALWSCPCKGLANNNNINSHYS